MDAPRKPRWPKVVILASVLCVLVLVGVPLYGLWKFKHAKPKGVSMPKVEGVTLFPLEYAMHVSGEPTGIDISRWYVSEAVHPDLARVRGSLRVPPMEDWYDGKGPFRDVVIEANLEDVLSEPCFSPETGLCRRISKPGEAPAFLCTIDEPYVLRHNPSLAKAEALLTFELQGTDAASGATKRERHHLHLIENPKAGSDLFAPPFLITAHTIEELPADEAE